MNAFSYPIIKENHSLVITNFQAVISENWGESPPDSQTLKLLACVIWKYEMRSIAACRSPQHENDVMCTSGHQFPHPRCTHILPVIISCPGEPHLVVTEQQQKGF